MSAHPDSNPNTGEKKGGGKRNEDARLGGAEWNTDHKPGAMGKLKEVVDPNDGNPSLGKQGGAEGSH